MSRDDLLTEFRAPFAIRQLPKEMVKKTLRAAQSGGDWMEIDVADNALAMRVFGAPATIACASYVANALSNNQGDDINARHLIDYFELHESEHYAAYLAEQLLLQVR